MEIKSDNSTSNRYVGLEICAVENNTQILLRTLLYLFSVIVKRGIIRTCAVVSWLCELCICFNGFLCVLFCSRPHYNGIIPTNSAPSGSGLSGSVEQNGSVSLGVNVMMTQTTRETLRSSNSNNDSSNNNNNSSSSSSNNNNNNSIGSSTR
jgi:hypothetical protein